MNTSYDIIIVGGGLSGFAAAVAAAREGAKALIVERFGFLGGAIGTSLINPFMPYVTKVNGERIFINGGIFKTLIEQLDEMGSLHENRDTFNEETLKLLLDRMAKAHGVDVLFHSYLIDAVTDGSMVKRITVANKSGKMEFSAKFFIDATGDADLSVLAGCNYQLGREPDHLCQPMTLCFRLGNVDLDAYRAVKPQINQLYQQFQKEGKIKNPREDVLIFSNMCDGVLHFNSTRIIKRNPVDAWDVSAAEMEAREQIFELYNFMKQNIRGFENSVLLMSAPQIGARESRMIEGEYKITSEDITSCRKFPDSIARGNYGIDVHSPEGTGTHIVYIPAGEYYTIPYRALIPKGKDNLLTVGRCISSDHEAQSAYRVMPICCCMGEGAGTAAAYAVANHTTAKGVDIDAVRATLIAHGALI